MRNVPETTLTKTEENKVEPKVDPFSKQPFQLELRPPSDQGFVAH